MLHSQIYMAYLPVQSSSSATSAIIALVERYLGLWGNVDL